MGSCFPCFNSEEGAQLNVENEKDQRREELPMVAPRVDKLLLDDRPVTKSNLNVKKELSEQMQKEGSEFAISAKTFTYRELSAATRNFREECFLGEGGFGRVYKGRLETGQVVAVKQLDRNGLQGNREFLVEVLMLSLLHSPNLVNLVGYCAEGDQRLLVYEFMAFGSLEDHLHDLPPEKEALDWNTRMKIAAGAAKGLEHLHDKASPPVIYRDFKSSNILLDEGFQPKLSDFGLAKLGPVGDESHVSTRVMGTYGYCAPEYAMTGQLTVKSDVYSFGVVLLEVITGRRAIDSTKPHVEQNLVTWARPMFSDRRKLPKLADPRLEGRYPMRGLYQALSVASMCIHEESASRPLIADVVTALSYLASQANDSSATQAANSKPAGGKTGRVDAEELDVRMPEGEPVYKWEPNNEKYSLKDTAGASKRDIERARAVAEAKMWGENWRQKMLANASDAEANVGFTGSNG